MINTLKKTIKLTNALAYIGLTKSTYFYASNPTRKKKREYKFDPELKKILLNLRPMVMRSAMANWAW